MNYSESENCEPNILEKENKYHSADFNCNNCGQTDCIYWILYNEKANPGAYTQYYNSKHPKLT